MRCLTRHGLFQAKQACTSLTGTLFACAGQSKFAEVKQGWELDGESDTKQVS